MSLTETIKELKEQIEETGDSVAEAAPEAAADSAPEEVAEPAPESAPEEKEDPSAFQRMRRETAAAKKRAEEAEAKLAERDKKPEEPEIPDVMQEIVETHNFGKAEKEFTSLERNFARKTKDYDSISAEYAGILATSIKVQNPRMSNIEVAERTKKTILQKAGKFLNDGFDPIEELYHEAKELGCTGKSATKTEEKEQEEEIKPDMNKVAANRKRSAGMSATGGESKGQITKQAAADLTIAEWGKLSASEKKRLMTT